MKMYIRPKKFHSIDPRPKKAAPKTDIPEKQEIPAMPVAESKPVEPFEVGCKSPLTVHL